MGNDGGRFGKEKEERDRKKAVTSLVLPYRLVVLNCPTVLLERDAPGRQLCKTGCLHYPQCNFKPLRGHHWKEFIRLHAAASKATKGFVLLLHSSTPLITLMYKNGGVTL